MARGKAKVPAGYVLIHTDEYQSCNVEVYNREKQYLVFVSDAASHRTIARSPSMVSLRDALRFADNSIQDWSN